MNGFLIFIIAVIIVKYVIDGAVDILNIRHADPRLPEEFAGLYDQEKYRRSQRYLREHTYFGLAENSFFTLVTVTFICAGGFNYVDHIARGVGWGMIPTGLIFCGMIVAAAQILNIPFAVYRTFGIEQRYGFNKTTPATFIGDIVKSLVLSALIGGIAFAGILWFFQRAGTEAWLYAWGAVALWQMGLMFIAPVVIMPLFNKFIPLSEGELKTTLEQYARAQNFAMQGVFTMDGSRRSTKSNAFFTGFGKFRRIALFDTLIAKHTTDELVSVLAHEIGHYKKRHILKGIILSLATTGLMFFLLSRFINNPALFAAFKMEQFSIYASFVFFGFLFEPVNMVISVLAGIISRRHEYEADRFAIETYQKPDAFIAALKKLSVDNFSNLTPHPLKVFLDYSHPPVLARIRRIREIVSRAGAQERTR